MTYLIENAMTPALRFSALRLGLLLVFFRNNPVSPGVIVAISRHLSLQPSHYFWVASSLLLRRRTGMLWFDEGCSHSSVWNWARAEGVVGIRGACGLLRIFILKQKNGCLN